MKKILLISLIISVFFGCSSSQKMYSNLPEQKLREVAYGSFSSSRMDVFLPANRNVQTPFVIILHGGAWTLGDKEWGMRTQDSLAAHGIASANINYRYADDNGTHYPELLKDIDSVINYCVTHAAEWNTRKTNFIINGESAGGHLALLYGYTTSNRINSIIVECAPTNFTDTAMLSNFAKHDTSVLHAICKMAGVKFSTFSLADPAFKAASPVTQVKNIPTLFFHGTADPLVPYSQALALEKALESKGYTHKLVTMPGAGHDVGFNTLAGRTKIYGEIIKWIGENN